MLKLHSSMRQPEAVSEHALEAGSNLSKEFTTDDSPSLIARACQVEWLGQTVASICWIVSVFAYGISSLGDCLQLAAASAWLLANIAALLARQPSNQ